MSSVDLAIIGAGPAGLAAATTARDAGLSVTLIDEAARPGGQIYRDIERSTRELMSILGPDYAHGRKLVDSFEGSGCTYLSSATVWHIEETTPGFRLFYSRNGASQALDTNALIVATGALERPMPLPGWTLPGVCTAGALQILLKTAGTVADDVVLVGNGPLLLLLAAQLVTAKCPPRAIVETSTLGTYLRALPHLPRALSGLGYLTKGYELMRCIRRAGVPVYRNANSIRLEGKDQIEAITFKSRGKIHRIETSSAGLHHGVVPNQQITRLMRCEHVWDNGERAFLPQTDSHGETSVSGLYVAGDGAGIRGARSAELAGRIAALRVAGKQGHTAASDTRRLRAELARDAAVRPFLEALYPPCAEALSPADDTLVCRCEEVSAGDVREAVRKNAPGPNQVKSFLRTGMGPCQGRVCGLVISQLVSEVSGRNLDDVGYFRIRPPLKPLALSELAEYDPGDQ
ncbi:NAD(P)/FAD-dependent oxidoreductase [Kordiimonas sp.]|uniref:FAD/NAD(P)-dependent oxidoreductase n=1 Tax=Kordiimonas sp. TaxID=1970157 RepID=UPI003A90ECC8